MLNFSVDFALSQRFTNAGLSRGKRTVTCKPSADRNLGLQALHPTDPLQPIIKRE